MWTACLLVQGMRVTAFLDPGSVSKPVRPAHSLATDLEMAVISDSIPAVLLSPLMTGEEAYKHTRRPYRRPASPPQDPAFFHCCTNEQPPRLMCTLVRSSRPDIHLSASYPIYRLGCHSQTTNGYSSFATVRARRTPWLAPC